MRDTLSVSDTVSAKEQFHKSVETTKPKRAKQNRGRQKTLRITLRLSDDENTQLRERAADMSVSNYVRQCV